MKQFIALLAAFGIFASAQAADPKKEAPKDSPKADAKKDEKKPASK